MQGTASNGKPMTAKFGTKLIWENEIEVNNFAGVGLPLQWETLYFLKDVKADHYTIEFRAVERSINDQKTNAPIFFNVSPP